MLLVDVHLLDDIQILEESKSKGTMRVRGTFQRAEEANSNDRIYPKMVLENQVKKIQPMIAERRLCGELDHPQSDTVRLSNASHLISKLWMEGNEVFGEAELLNTPSGKVAQALINDGVKVGISSRGLGTVTEGVYGRSKTVNDDYRLVTFDLVADPSTRGAYPGLSESISHMDEKYERTLHQAISEKVFITLLKDKLNEGHKKKSPKAVSQHSEYMEFDDPHVKSKRGAKKKGKKASSRAARRTQDVRTDEWRRPRVTKRDLEAKKRKLRATIQRRLEYERSLDASGSEEKKEESNSPYNEASYDRTPRHRRTVHRSGTPSKTKSNSALMKWLRGEDWKKDEKPKKRKKS